MRNLVTLDQEHRVTKAFALIQPKMIVIECSDDSDAAKLKGVEVYIQDHLLDRSLNNFAEDS